MVRILFSVWFSIQGIIENTTCSVWFRIQGIIQTTNCIFWFIIQTIIQKRRGYYSAYGSGFSVLFNIRAASSGSLFSVLLKNGQDVIQRMVQYSGYYSKYDLQRLVHYSGYYSKHDLQRLVQDSGCYSKYELQRLVHYSGYYSKEARVLVSLWFRIQGINQSTTCSV